MKLYSKTELEIIYSFARTLNCSICIKTENIKKKVFQHVRIPFSYIKLFSYQILLVQAITRFRIGYLLLI